jgi:hypothetical protein
MILEDPKKQDLSGGRDLSNLIEKDGPVMS